MRLLLDVEKAWLSDDQRVQAARTLIEHGMVFSSFELARSAVLSTRSIVDNAKGGALHRGRWFIAAAYAYFQRDDTKECLTYFERRARWQSSRIPLGCPSSSASRYLTTG